MRRRFLSTVLVSDLAALLGAVAIGLWIVFGTALPWQVVLPASATSSVWPMLAMLGISALAASTASIRLWKRNAPRPSYGRAVGIISATIAATAIGIVLARPYHSNGVLGITTTVWLAGAFGHRWFRRRRPWTESLLVITSEKGLADDLRNAPHADVIAVFDPSGDPPADPPSRGVTLAVDLRPVMSDRMAQYVSSWNLAGFPMRALSSVYEEHTGRLPLVHIAEGWELSTPVERNAYAGFKRVIDAVLVFVTLPVWLIVGGIFWVMVRLDSPGPAIYKQVRVGRNGTTFTLYKFRSMVVDAERGGPRFAAKGDDRLTRVGRWLRRIRMDEIPQLWNVLKGDLSLVGPRPERPMFTERFGRTIPFYGYRHLIRPGLTGWAQVNYGYADGDADTIDKLTYDLYYIKHMSPWLDLDVLGKSIWTVLSGFGAR
jgi:exopolysaccharide biosynthesis polyprenyl glycosylphosphotransferase